MIHAPFLRRNLAAAVLPTISAVVASAQPGDNLIVPSQRIGPIRIGMTLAEV